MKYKVGDNMDLMGSVRERHSKSVAATGRFTLIHRIITPAQKETPQKKSGILNFFGSRFTHISKKIQEDVASILGRWSHAQERSLTAKIDKETARQTSMWKDFAARTEKTRLEHSRNTDKRFDLVVAETNKKLTTLRRDSDRALRREIDRKRELESMPREARPVSVKDARRLIEGKVGESNSKLETQIEQSARKSIRDAVRRVRDEDAYNRLRNGGRRKL